MILNIHFYFNHFQNDTVVDALNRYPFYLLPLKKQEMLALILNRMQHGAKIQMGPFRVLNYETSTDVRFFEAYVKHTRQTHEEILKIDLFFS